MHLHHFSLSLSTPLFNLPALTPLFLHCLCSVPLSSPTVVSGYGGEVVPTGRDKVPEGEAEPLRLSGRFHHCHHWKKAAAAAESDGAAAGGELQVQAVHTIQHSSHNSVYSVTQTLLLCHVNLRLENSRDDMRVRGEILEREMADLHQRNEELTSLAQEAQALKDEMDILR